jgi:GNAT superfamily N-acetyltransferase
LSKANRFSVRLGTAEDAEPLARLHTAVAEHLTGKFGPGAWSRKTSEKGVLLALRMSKVYAVREGNEIVGTFTLSTKKPWAIDASYFAKVDKPLYLVGMAVAPAMQRRGIGRRCLEEAKRIAWEWPADAIRLDAFDADAGAGGFYARCGFTEVGRASYRDTPHIYFEALRP